MRRNRLSAIGLAGVLALVGWGLPVTAAFADAPVTVPTITAPADTATVAGDVPVTATSTAASVQFYVDGIALGTPVAVDTGTASTTWSTWGTANGAHTLTAADCSGVDCNVTVSTPVGVTLTNTDPAVTAPADGADTDASPTITADAPGGGVAFFLDGTQVGFDGTAPYSFDVAGPLTLGDHTASVTECDAADTVCAGPVAPTVTFHVAVPATVPAITAPADAASVAGDVVVTATSTAPSVQFFLDDVALGAPVAVAAGVASTSWSSWGAANGAHTLTAADCNDAGCNVTVSTPVGVTLANTDPTVTAPLDGATTGTGVTLQADAGGGGLAFFLDGAEVGFDGTAPYSFDVAGPLTVGDHTASVTECDTVESACDGPVSSTVTFTVATLQPQITSGSPNPFSPHHDGRDDKTSFHLHLPDAENVSFSIQNVNHTIIQGPHTPGMLGAGGHSITWDGKNNSGKIAGDGTYTLVVTTTATVNGADLQGTATRTVRVDDTPTHFKGITGNGFTFYPVTDGYLDTFGPKVTVDEGGGLWLEIYNSSGSKVREIAFPHASKGTMQFHWNGRTAGGGLLKAGTYRYFFKAQDAAGNRSLSANYHVNLRHEHIVNKTATLHHDGRDGVLSTTDLSCTGASFGLSAFPHGVWLDNVCPRSDGDQVIVGAYTFTAPGAVRYNNVRLRSYGNTIDAPEAIAAIIFNWSTHGYDTIGGALVSQNNVNAWTNFGTVSTTNRVSSSRAIKVVIGVPNITPPEDYDIGLVELTVSYSVLHS
jgi:flagellar hook assembly protein FlgD